MTEKSAEHIINYLNWYINDKSEKRFAVLIKGGWGSGKTWFIKKFIEDNDNGVKKKSSETNFIYLSLYGLETIDDLDDQIFQKLHPILSDKKLGFLGKLGKNFLNKHIVEVPKYELSDVLKNFGNKILVLDDLERCNISVEKVLGYINSFVEHQSKKVIIVANDEEIESGLSDEEKKQGSRYHQIKEKVIGKTFKIETDIPTVINLLIEENAYSCKAALLSRKDLLVEIFETVKDKTEKKHANYRAFSHAIKYFEYVWNKLDSKYQEHKELITDFMDIFMRLAYELQLGLITEQDIVNIRAAEMARVIGRINNTDKEQKSNKYEALEAFFDRNKLHSSNMLLPPKLWARILCEAIINLNEIYESLNNSTHFRNQTRADWVSLWYFIEIEDNDAKRIIKSIVKELNNRSYEDPGVVFHIYGSLLRRNEEGFELPEEIGNTPEEIEKHARKYIDHLYETDRLPKREALTNMYLDTAYRGLGYTSLESKYFKKN